MTFPRLSGSILAAALVWGALAQAQQVVPPGDDGFRKYGEVGEWVVYVDIARGSCLIERAQDGRVVQMGLTADHRFGYVGVFAQIDTDLAQGETEEVFIEIDGMVFQSEVTGIKGNVTGGYNGGYVLANNPAFADAVANGRNMTVFPGNDGMFTVDLTGTKKAMEAARACNRAQLG